MHANGDCRPIVLGVIVAIASLLACASGAAAQLLGYQSFNEVTVGPGAVLDGNVAMHLESLDLCSTAFLDLDCGAVVDAEVAIAVHAAVNFYAETSASFDARVPIISTALVPISVGQLTIIPLLHLDLTASGAASAGLTTGWVSKVPVRIAFAVDDDGVHFDGTSADVEFFLSPPTVDGQAHAEIQLQAGISLELLIFLEEIPLPVAPGITVGSGTRLRVDPNERPWWALDGVFSADAFVKVPFSTPAITHMARAVLPGIVEADESTAPPATIANETVRWAAVYDLGLLADKVQAITESVTTPGNYVVALTRGSSRGAVMETDALGAPIWARKLKFQNPVSASDHVPLDIAPLPNGGYALAGRASGNRAWLAEIDMAGDLLWSKAYVGATRFVRVIPLDRPGESGFLVAGQVYDPAGYGHNLVARLDQSGRVLWANGYETNLGGGDGPYDLVRTTNGGAALVGTIGHPEKRNGLVVMLSPALDGGVSWSQITPENCELDGGPAVANSSYAVVPTDDGGVIVASGENREPRRLLCDPDPDLASVTISRWSADGALNAKEVRFTPDGDADTVEPWSIALVPGGTLVAGSVTDGARAAWVSGLDDSQLPRFLRSYAGGGPSAFRTIVPTPDGGALLGGHIERDGSDRALLVKIPSDGIVRPLDPSGGLSVGSTDLDRLDSFGEGRDDILDNPQSSGVPLPLPLYSYDEQSSGSLPVLVPSRTILSERQIPACALDSGDVEYCSDPACGPCGLGEGDCDAHSECELGLVCASNVGTAYGLPSNYDVCEIRSGNCERANGDPAYCSDVTCGPCDAGEGDCDDDSECASGLVCARDVGAAYGLPSNYDVCEPSPTTCERPSGDPAFCSDPLCGPCAAGEGDCDTDIECGPGLVCVHDVGASYGLPNHFDVCQPPPTSCERAPGDTQYCADPLCGPCRAGEGDCDGDHECAANLVCAYDVGADYGLPSHYDVCEALAASSR